MPEDRIRDFYANMATLSVLLGRVKRKRLHPVLDIWE